MPWSIRLGSAFGVGVYLHLTLLLLFGVIGWLGWQLGGLVSCVWALILSSALFGCVLLHEFGHVLVARRFGVQVRRVTLLPIGGVASMGRLPESSGREFLIAVAGPMVNVLILALLTAGLGGDWLFRDPPAIPRSLPDLALLVAYANLLLVLFNLLPAFPMDGGRILRSVLSAVLPYVTATRIASWVGQTFAVGFCAVSVRYGLPVLFLVGLFVFFGARMEAAAVIHRHRLRGVLARDLMQPDRAHLQDDVELSACADSCARFGQRDFPVWDGGRLAGVLSRRAWKRALKREGPQAGVGEVMTRRFIALRPETSLQDVYRDLKAMKQECFPVVEDGHCLGILSVDAIARRLRSPNPRAAADPKPATSNRSPRPPVQVPWVEPE
jgi:Zn-dependent protease/predicted transcriptional regulator